MNTFGKSKRNTPTMKEGDKFTSNNHGEFEIVGYLSTHHIRVKFLDTGEIGYTSARGIRRGQVNPYKPNKELS